MTLCEKIYQKMEFCSGMYRNALKKGDYEMAKFYSNAYVGYKTKLSNMTVEQLSEVE